MYLATKAKNFDRIVRTLKKHFKKVLSDSEFDQEEVDEAITEIGSTFETEETVLRFDDDMIDESSVWEALEKLGYKAIFRELLDGEVVDTPDEGCQVFEDGDLMWGATLYVFEPITEKSVWWENAKKGKAPLNTFGKWLQKPDENYDALGDKNFESLLSWCQSIEGWNENTLTYYSYSPE